MGGRRGGRWKVTERTAVTQRGQYCKEANGPFRLAGIVRKTEALFQSSFPWFCLFIILPISRDGNGKMMAGKIMGLG